MPKIILGKRPATFVKKVSIPQLDGTAAEITFTFRTRTRTEYAAVVDEYKAAVRALGDTAAATNAREEVVTLEHFIGQNIEVDANLILKIAEGWDLDDAFSKDVIIQFLDEFGGAMASVTDACRSALNEGYLGN